jgi:hypothetical protein
MHIAPPLAAVVAQIWFRMLRVSAVFGCMAIVMIIVTIVMSCLMMISVFLYARDGLPLLVLPLAKLVMGGVTVGGAVGILQSLIEPRGKFHVQITLAAVFVGIWWVISDGAFGDFIYGSWLQLIEWYEFRNNNKFFSFAYPSSQ